MKCASSVVNKYPSFMRVICVVLFTGWTSTTFAKALDEKFLTLQTEIASFTPHVEPILRPIKLRYGPVTGATNKIWVLNRVDSSSDSGSPLFISMRIQNAYEQSIMDDGTLKKISEIKLEQAETDGKGKLTLDNKLPDGTKIVSIMSDTGELKSIQFETPQEADSSQLPRPGTKEFMEVIDFISTYKILNQQVSQGDQIFPPILFAVGFEDVKVSKGGYAPSLMGRVACGNKKCLFVRIDETMETDEHPVYGAKLVGTANGYMLLDEQTLEVHKSLIWVHSDMRFKSGYMITDMIMESVGTSR